MIFDFGHAILPRKNKGFSSMINVAPKNKLIKINRSREGRFSVADIPTIKTLTS